jgi:hypothetical protein
LPPLQFLPLIATKNRPQPQRHLRKSSREVSARSHQVIDRFIGFPLVERALAQGDLKVAIGPLHRFPQIQQVAAIFPHRAANFLPLSVGQTQILDDRAVPPRTLPERRTLPQSWPGNLRQ